ncbi:MAG: hypothetical protein II877_04450, partial [Synergistaceae bacterium]|nr:hypothetical protein [Synergistaceae bacterium]
MKKLFALMLVVAMLSVAGSAMAAARVTATPASVTVTAGGSTATSSLAGEDTDHPQGSWVFSKVSGPAWATVSGTTASFAPATGTAAGTESLVVRGVETYTMTDDAGHVSTGSADATVTISITVRAPSGTETEASEKATTTQQTVTFKVKVKVISVSSAVFATKASMAT